MVLERGICMQEQVHAVSFPSIRLYGLKQTLHFPFCSVCFLYICLQELHQFSIGCLFVNGTLMLEEENFQM
jgi:hypothetical protein